MYYNKTFFFFLGKKHFQVDFCTARRTRGRLYVSGRKKLITLINTITYKRRVGQYYRYRVLYVIQVMVHKNGRRPGSGESDSNYIV